MNGTAHLALLLNGIDLRLELLHSLVSGRRSALGAVALHHPLDV
jgi:hypothetical protein